MKTFIVIPTYNERDNIERLLTEIFQLRIPELSVIVVDDNSPDGTTDIAKRLAAGYPIHVIQREKKQGIGSAYIAGFKKALVDGADYIFEMDADLSHDPHDIPRLLEKMNGCDLAIGSRRVPGGDIVGWNMRRHFTSSAATIFSRFILKLKTNDVTAGFRCYRRKVLESINLDAITSNGYAFQEEMLYKTEQSGFVVVEVPVTFIDRKKGKSKLSSRDIIEFFAVMMRLRLHRNRH